MRFVCFVTFILMSLSGLSQTTLKNYRRGTNFQHPEFKTMTASDSMKVESVIDHIVKSLHHQSHSERTGAIYHIELLNPSLCYREFINKTTGASFHILVGCEELHARSGQSIIDKNIKK